MRWLLRFGGFGLVSACGSAVVAPGRLIIEEDPSDPAAEQRLVLTDLESGGVAMNAYGFSAHRGALFDVFGDHDVVRWMACNEVVLTIRGEAVTASAVEHQLDSDNDPTFHMVTHRERLSFQLDDDELAWLARAEAPLALDLCGTRATIAGRPLATLVEFAREVAARHTAAGDAYLPPLVVPSDRP